LTNELLPQFRKQRSGKIITIGSIMGLLNFPSAAYYGASKHALEGYFKSLRFELNEFKIKVSMVEPMGFKTGIISNSIVANRKITDYDNYRNKIERFSKDLFDKSPDPAPVINTLLRLIEDENPTFNHPVGKGASLFWAIQHFAYKIFENSLIKTINKFK
jgi:short-subunit dehydrogenase